MLVHTRRVTVWTCAANFKPGDVPFAKVDIPRPYTARDLRRPAMLEGLIYLVINIVVVGLVIWLLRFLIELNPLAGRCGASPTSRWW